MPAFIYRSALMQSRKVALVSQNATEQSNGLVEVSVEYSAVASDRDDVLALFKTDMPPPIVPSIVDHYTLQTERLYLRNYSYAQANGMLTISASYVGANFAALQSPAIFSDFELFGFDVSTAAYYSSTTGGPGEPSFSTPRLDLYGFDCNLRVEEQQAAVIDRQKITLGPPPAFSESNREGLVMGAVFRYRSIFGADSGNIPVRDRLSGWRYRSMTASEILEVMSQKQADGTTGFNVAKTQKVEHITPTVKLISDVYQAELNRSSLIINLGFFS